MRSNVCVNEIALHLGHLYLLSKAKHSSTVMDKKEVCPRDEMIADPPGTAVLPIDRRHGFAEGLVSFRALCGVQSLLVSSICSWLTVLNV